MTNNSIIAAAEIQYKTIKLTVYTDLGKYVIHRVTSISITFTQYPQQSKQSDMEKRVCETSSIILW